MAFNREGVRPPLFFVHPGQAGAEAYVGLATLLDKALPFYAVESRNLYEGAVPRLETIESLCGAYLEDVLAVCGKGPCSLGGWSFGGLVAFEMARRMRELGVEVEDLFLLGTRPFPGGARGMHWWSWRAVGKPRTSWPTTPSTRGCPRRTAPGWWR